MRAWERKKNRVKNTAGEIQTHLRPEAWRGHVGIQIDGKNLFMDVSEEKEVWTETITAECPK